MIKPTTLQFLSKLKLHNTRAWFEQNRDLYENYRSDILQLTENLLKELSNTDQAILQANLDPKKCLTRVNRDLRFSKDKTPYKNYVLIVFNKNYPQPNKAGYFIHIEPGNCSVGGGVWQTTPEYLKKIRQEIDYSFTDFSKIISSPDFEKTFPNGIQGVGKLKKIPEGYEETHPAIELLKMKGFCTKEPLQDAILTSKDGIQTIMEYFKTAKPLIDYINNAIEYEE
jgi:uncharacterized protein (TIGR02453 family)